MYIFTTGKNLEKTTSSLAVPSKDARINKHVRLGVKSPSDAYFFIQTKTKIFVPTQKYHFGGLIPSAYLCEVQAAFFARTSRKS